jgi:hypothetical protein
MPRADLWAVGFLVCVGHGSATAAEGSPILTPTPTPTIVRYDEDWSGLATPAHRTGRWTEAFKYVPLDEPGDAYLTTGLEVRLRRETYRDNLWGGAEAANDSAAWIRALPYADLHVGAVRAFVQPIAAYGLGVSPAASPIDQTRVDLLQGFADVSLPIGDADVTLRAGRQMLSLGTERLIGTRYGPNLPLAFDGVRAIVKTGGATIDLFQLRPVRPGPRAFDDRSSPTKRLWGAYATTAALDVYYLGYNNREARFDLGTGAEHRHTVGMRGFGSSGDWSWNVEGAGQFGRFADKRIRAWSVGAELGRGFSDIAFKPRIVTRFNVVSGDTRSGDRTLGTFNALFPKGKYFGELSPIGPYNIINLNPAVTFDLRDDLSVGLAGQAYWRYALQDGVYDIPGNLIRSGQGARGRVIGQQVEATVDWRATPELELSASLSAFRPGDVIRETGPARTLAMIGLEANFRF